MTLAITIGIMVAGGVYLMLQRGMVRIVFGLILVGHAVNLLIMSAGGVGRRDLPLLQFGTALTAGDPLPQAFVLTAIVIAFSIAIYMLTLAASGSDDDTEDAS
ncbi:sodium:proton antiporter [Nocardiopsis ganjiahuensis]|uniref:sodium:proton antiporter n=1 Tax=Nocardiopsis ganjiahuensis TaxID=239984 RepID=UPI000346BC16|nr:cation:proton antiporter subunit C [Nocardiopsis ganjiahuensis]